MILVTIGDEVQWRIEETKGDMRILREAKIIAYIPKDFPNAKKAFNEAVNAMIIEITDYIEKMKKRRFE